MDRGSARDSRMRERKGPSTGTGPQERQLASGRKTLESTTSEEEIPSTTPQGAKGSSSSLRSLSRGKSVSYKNESSRSTSISDWDSSTSRGKTAKLSPVSSQSVPRKSTVGATMGRSIMERKSVLRYDFEKGQKERVAEHQRTEKEKKEMKKSQIDSTKAIPPKEVPPKKTELPVNNRIPVRRATVRKPPDFEEKYDSLSPQFRQKSRVIDRHKSLGRESSQDEDLKEEMMRKQERKYKKMSLDARPTKSLEDLRSKEQPKSSFKPYHMKEPKESATKETGESEKSVGSTSRRTDQGRKSEISKSFLTGESEKASELKKTSITPKHLNLHRSSEIEKRMSTRNDSFKTRGTDNKKESQRRFTNLEKELAHQRKTTAKSDQTKILPPPKSQDTRKRNKLHKKKTDSDKQGQTTESDTELDIGKRRSKSDSLGAEMSEIESPDESALTEGPSNKAGNKKNRKSRVEEGLRAFPHAGSEGSRGTMGDSKEKGKHTGKGRMTGDEEDLDKSTKMRRKSNQEDGSQSTRKGKMHKLITEAGYTEILASLVPDEIIYNLHETTYRKYDVCLLFGDASGFTDLCERYSKTGKGGPSRLTVVLNSFIGTMVQEIMTHGGDVLKFSGDAFLSWWRVSDNLTSLQDAVALAIETALIIQKRYGKYETDVGVTLRVKLAISAGQVGFSSIGTEDTKHYIVLGRPVIDVKVAEYLCVAGDIMVTPRAWTYVNPQDYDHEFMPDSLHVKVLAPGVGWRNIMGGYDGAGEATNTRGRDDYSSEDRGMVSMIFLGGDDENAIIDVESISSDEMEDEAQKAREREATAKQDEITSLRPSVRYALKNNMKTSLRPYVIKPVLKGLDMDEPIEYLTEMRQVVIVFTNLVTQNPPMGKMIRLVDKCYRIVCSSVHAHQGCVNKTSLFDKDLMFLIIFGLRGFKHEMESQIALRCGAELHERLTSVNMVRSTSVGITTGMTYCGVVGHTLRREYSVIGPTVNKAARIMVAYPGKVTCDRDTFLHSRLEASSFILQEHKELKGLQQAGPIYEFREHLMPRNTHVLSKFPLLSRGDELDLLKVLLEEAQIRFYPDRKRETDSKDKGGRYKSSFMDESSGMGKDGLAKLTKADLEQRSSSYFISGLIVRGEARMGKSRLLDEMLHIGETFGDKVARIALTPKDYQTTLFGINKILDPIMKFPEDATKRDKEEIVLKLIRKVKSTYWQYLYTLNELFQISIDFKLTHPSERFNEPLTAMKRSLWIILSQVVTDHWIIGVDDLEFLDEASWELLPILLEKDFAFFVMTLGNRLELDQYHEDILRKNKHLYHITLGGIDKWYHAALACQVLDVWAIPPELERLLHERSRGNPGWVESYLVTQLQQKVIQVASMTQDESDGMGLVRPPARMITRAAAKRAARMAKKPMVDPSRLQPTEDRWEMFKKCYHDSMEYIARQTGEDTTLGADGTPLLLSPPDDADEDELNYSSEGKKDSDITGSDDSRHKYDEKKSISPDNRKSVLKKLKMRKMMRKKDRYGAGSQGMPYVHGKLIAVCVLTPGTELLGEADEDLTETSMMLKVFDSLTSYEQMLLKCASVLGESFMRKMLTSLLGDPDLRELAECVQKLFDMGVVTCASADQGGPLTSVSVTYSQGMSGDMQSTGGIVACQCPDLEVDERNRDLPVYASCDYMRFRTTAFRDMTYSLLTDAQKKEYHERAMRYLEQETRRCAACGRRHFLLLLGNRHEQRLIRRYNRKRWQQERARMKGRGPENGADSVSSAGSDTGQESGGGSLAGSLGGGSRRSSQEAGSSPGDSVASSQRQSRTFMQLVTYEDMLLNKIRQPWGDPDELPQSGIIDRTKTTGRYLPTRFPWSFLGFCQRRGSVPSAAGLSLTRSFSSFNFTECECTLILTTVYAQVLTHCRGAELDEKTMDALLEYAEVCVYSSNHAQAQRLLVEARKLLAGAKREPEFGIKKVDDMREGSYIPSWKWPYLMGRIHTLLGCSRLELGQYEEAHYQLHLAMAHMGVPFPANRFMLRAATLVTNMRLSLTTSLMARAWMGLRTGFAATYADAIASCLALMYVVFRDMGDWMSARLAATWGLIRSLESGLDFLGVCVSFANMLEVLQYDGNFVTCAKLEVGAMEVCRNRASYLEIQELIAVGRLYRIVFHSLMTRGRIESAISVGYKTLRIATAVHATGQRLDVLPGLIRCLVARNRVSEAVSLLNELEFIAEEDVDKTGITWYYALSLEVHLYTGYSVLPYLQCEEFFKREGESLYTGRNPQSAHRLYAALWLWCMRLEDWEGAKVWEELARPEFSVPDLYSVRQFAVTITLIMQGYSIKLAYLMDIDDREVIAETKKKIENWFELFRKVCSYIRYAEPDFLSVKAYYMYLTSQNNPAKKKKALHALRSASEAAARQGNARLAEWCKHNEKWWRGLLAPVKADAWLECAYPDTLVDWHEADKTPPRIMHFTLPLPTCLD